LSNLDPVTFEIVKNSLVSLAEEMGVVLRRSSFSPNIKERRDFSCALFDAEGRLVTQAEHIPVHLGAMPHAVKTILHNYDDDIAEGDEFILNDPFRGGTHLPDITIVSPIFYRGERIVFAANRAHHSDVGGGTPGSMSALSTDVFQEGIKIPPVKLAEKGKINRQLLDFILSNVRTPRERLGDLRAQEAANDSGKKRFHELAEKMGLRTVLTGMRQLMDYSSRLMLMEIRKIPSGSSRAVDYLDNDGFDAANIPIKVKLTVGNGRIVFDFSGSSRQVRGPVNAVYSITLSAVYYVVRCVTDPEIPPNDGCFRQVEVIAPQGTIVNAQPPAPVAGGNVETSQRIVDVALKAFGSIVPERVCAACQGTMNNVTIGGTDPETGRYFTYYETIAGGFGGRYGRDGIDGVHSHMTNTLNTPVEALENGFPIRVQRYELVPGSGGRGRFRGGLGVRRDLEILSDEVTVSLLGDRQTTAPWGFQGGNAGAPGHYSLIREDGPIESLASKSTTRVRRGDVLSVSTPGGGGYGPPNRRAAQLEMSDRLDGKLRIIARRST
jgi:N-methylhydantoinase B